jgi:type I restriction enzyme S subunit
MKELDAIISPIIEQFINNNIEIRKLSNLRDTLLPKLMSGEIDVNEVEI